MNWFEAIILGAVQGATEFLPVSSSGHLTLGQHLLGVPEPGLLFDIILHVGTLLSVMAFYRREIFDVLDGLRRGVGNLAREKTLGAFARPEGARVALLVVAATVPTGIIGLLLKGFIDRAFLPGWAFSHEPGKSGLPEGLLAGRSARVLSTMDSPSWWYSLKHRRAAHRALTHATLNYVGISSVRETTVYKLRTLDDAARTRWLERAREVGARDAR